MKPIPGPREASSEIVTDEHTPKTELSTRLRMGCSNQIPNMGTPNCISSFIVGIVVVVVLTVGLLLLWKFCCIILLLSLYGVDITVLPKIRLSLMKTLDAYD